ncbi:hypothetical protein TWF730_008944 [Orbilia blumenaviensis]|uniref:Uncharacterized protein n=1 Tax=Orbilia blumenaviensis TaxID=1796055 RepID=A0AAV9UX35_9PEZI
MSDNQSSQMAQVDNGTSTQALNLKLQTPGPNNDNNNDNDYMNSATQLLTPPASPQPPPNPPCTPATPAQKRDRHRSYSPYNAACYATSRAYNGIVWALAHGTIHSLPDEEISTLIKSQMSNEMKYVVQGMDCWEDNIIRASLELKGVWCDVEERAMAKEGLMKILRRYYGYDECKGDGTVVV